MANSLDVFISWSGQRSRAVGLALHEWLKAVVQRANPWMSERDIGAGQRWSEQISARLRDTHFGIICLTPENLNAPWLLFEAGALAKALELARIVPVLLDMRKADLGFPLAQFQAVEADREGMFELVSALNRSLGDQQLSGTVLVNIFGGLWGNFEAALRALPPAPTQATHTQRTDRDLLEEVLERIRILQQSARGTTPIGMEAGDSGDWEDYYIRGVNLANSREGNASDLGALRAYSEAIALVPTGLSKNDRSRLHAYRGAVLKRLGRLEEAQQDLVLAQKWAHADREINDALYNLASVAALDGRNTEALSLAGQLISRDSRWARILAKNKYFASMEGNPEFAQLVKGS
jgi:tetratricopeptide (TPR) repeat protein